MNDSSETPFDPLTPSRLFGGLPVSRLRMAVSFSRPPELPPRTGSAWRGLLGWEIKSLICPFDRRPDCAGCVIRESCPYFRLFEMESPLSGLSETPRGYIVSPEPVDRDNRQTILITLMGACVKFLPVALQAVLTGQQRGLGGRRDAYQVEAADELIPGGAARSLRFSPDGIVETRGPFPLARWLEETGPSPDAPRAVRLATPVRLRQKGKYVGGMDWPFFFATLARRLESLNRLYNGGEPLGKDTWLSLREVFAVNGLIRADLAWEDLSRYSNRQHQKIPMGGLTGRAALAAPDPRLAQWLRAAELVHVGKGASMGWGKVVVE